MKFSELQRMQRANGLTVTSADERISKLESCIANAMEERDALRAELDAIRSKLPDDLYPGSKDWRESDAAGRIDWLVGMYESVNADSDSIIQVEFPLRIEKVAEGWKAKCERLESKLGALQAELDALKRQEEEALNTLCKMFHAGEEFEGPDGMITAIDLSLWHEGCEAIEMLVGGEKDRCGKYQEKKE